MVFLMCLTLDGNSCDKNVARPLDRRPGTLHYFITTFYLTPRNTLWHKSSEIKTLFNYTLKGVTEEGMDDTLYYILGGIITGGALICFIFSYYSDYREQHCRKRRSLYSIINREP